MVHIVESVEKMLDPLRASWKTCCNNKKIGSPAIRIVSGYRSSELNRLMGGPVTSVHHSGYAFDLVPSNGCMKKFKDFCRDFFTGKAFDQLISENEDSTGIPSLIHVGYRHPDGVQQREQYLSLIDGKYYPMTK